MDNVKIMICCHKDCELPKDDIFLPIQVGAKISNVNLGFQHDDVVGDEICDNISDKNKSYCELTAMYWAWKNIRKIYPALEYIGLNHYRRYFSFDENKSFDDVIIKDEAFLGKYEINRKKLGKYLNKDKIIVAKRHFYPYPVSVDYSVGHISDDFKILKQVVHDLYPDYDDVFYKTLMRQNGISHYNMFVMKYDDYNEYCKWLFDILFECEKRINIDNYNPVQSRIWGYMAERLFNVWLYKNKKKKLVLLNIYKIANDEREMNRIKRLILVILYRLSNIIIRSHSKLQRESDILNEKTYLRMIGQK